MSDYFNDLKGIDSIQDLTLSTQIAIGVQQWLDWGLLRKGNYFNVELNETYPNGEDGSKLALDSSAAGYTSGQVWNGFSKNWVWESGIGYSPEPLVGTDNSNPGISGVYVNDDFYPITTTGAYSHWVDYTNGRVIFDSPIPTGSKVQAEYSYKWINVVFAGDVPWMKTIVNASQPTARFREVNQGKWDIPPEMRLEIPAIAVEVVPTKSYKGYQLGGGQWVYTDILLHCIADNRPTLDKMVDIVSDQNEATIWLLNQNSISDNSAMPLDYRGVPNAGALRYPDLVAAYPGGKLRLTQTKVSEIYTDGDFHGAVVRIKTEGIKTTI